MASDDEALVVSVYDGEFFGDMSSLVRLYVVEGSAAPSGKDPSSALDEAWRLLEMYAEKYPTVPPRGDCFTVFIGGKSRGDNEVEPLVRLDVYAHNGVAVASVVSRMPRWDTERVSYAPDDDAVAIVCKILRANLGGAS